MMSSEEIEDEELFGMYMLRSKKIDPKHPSTFLREHSPLLVCPHELLQ